MAFLAYLGFLDRCSLTCENTTCSDLTTECFGDASLSALQFYCPHCILCCKQIQTSAAFRWWLDDAWDYERYYYNDWYDDRNINYDDLLEWDY